MYMYLSSPFPKSPSNECHSDLNVFVSKSTSKEGNSGLNAFVSFLKEHLKLRSFWSECSCLLSQRTWWKQTLTNLYKLYPQPSSWYVNIFFSTETTDTFLCDALLMSITTYVFVGSVVAVHAFCDVSLNEFGSLYVDGTFSLYLYTWTVVFIIVLRRGSCRNSSIVGLRGCLLCIVCVCVCGGGGGGVKGEGVFRVWYCLMSCRCIPWVTFCFMTIALLRKIVVIAFFFFFFFFFFGRFVTYALCVIICLLFLLLSLVRYVLWFRTSWNLLYYFNTGHRLPHFIDRINAYKHIHAKYRIYPFGHLNS